MIAILWLIQTVYLDEFYTYIKRKDMKSAIAVIEDSVNSDGLDEIVETVASNYDVCILITDTEYNTLYSADINSECTIHTLNSKALNRLYERAVSNGGSVTIESADLNELLKGFKSGNFPDDIEIPTQMQDENVTEDETAENETGEETETSIESKYTTGDSSQKTDRNIIHFDNYDSYPESLERRNLSREGVVFVEKLTTSDGTEMIFYLNIIITPVDAIVYTIRIQLLFISIILIILALIIAIFISYSVSNSLSKVNENAKKLAKGDFDVVFDSNDYKEISELSSTLNYAADELGKAEEIQRDLIANVSHDLRTPLTMISAYAEVMRDIPGENNAENVQVIIDESNRLSLLVNDLLEVSKLQAGVDELKVSVYDITDSIKAVIDRYAKLVEQKGYTVTFNYYENVYVNADEYKIYQVIYNLVNNAINYTGEDKTVTVNQIVKGSIVRIEVIDSGVGIPQNELKNVWQRYYKIDKNHKRTVIGTGLGLSIVKNILVKHGAKYGVNSTVGEGSTFWFELEKVDK